SAENPNFDDLLFNMMVVESNTSIDIQDSPYGYVYIIFANNRNSFSNFHSILSDPRKVNVKNTELTQMYQEEGNWNEVPQLQLAKTFLRYINDPSATNFNISLYRCKLDNEFEITGDWEKLTLNSTQQYGIQKKPCK